MREHLYRAKKADNKEWVYGDLIQKINDEIYIASGWIINEDEFGNYTSFDCECLDKVIPATVCEWSGLIDKNGKKIFEGDKVKFINPYPFADTKGTVAFNNGCFVVEFECNCGTEVLSVLPLTTIEAIGTIFDEGK